MKKINVLIVAGDMGLGGLENQLVYLVRNADRNKYQFDFTTTVSDPYYKNEVESLGGRFIYIDYSKGGRQILRYCRSLANIINQGNYDVVHSHELFHSGIVLLIAKLCGVKKRFSHAHSCNQKNGFNLFKLCYHLLMRYLIKRCATKYLACSSMAATFLYGKRIINNPKYQLIMNGIDTKKYLAELPSGENNEFAEGEWKNIIQVGRFSDEKNYSFTCEIVKLYKDTGKLIRFLCVGNDGNDYEQQIRCLINQYGIDNYMLLLGERDDVNVLLKKADAFILPSKFEGMPLSLIEAQTSGLNCVVSNRFSHEVDFGIGAIKWLDLEDGPERWAAALEEAIMKGKCNKDQIIEAIEKYGFDSSHFAKKLYTLYEGEE